MKRFLLVMVIGVMGCGAEREPEDDGLDDSFAVAGKGDTGGIAEGSLEAKGVLKVANDLNTQQLRSVVNLSERAAENIVNVREGDDGVVGTSDDVKFLKLEQLDDVPYVGPQAFQKLLAYAMTAGFLNSGVTTPTTTLHATGACGTSVSLYEGKYVTAGAGQNAQLSFSVANTNGASAFVFVAARSGVTPGTVTGAITSAPDGSVIVHGLQLSGGTWTTTGDLRASIANGTMTATYSGSYCVVVADNRGSYTDCFYQSCGWSYVL